MKKKMRTMISIVFLLALASVPKQVVAGSDHTEFVMQLSDHLSSWFSRVRNLDSKRLLQDQKALYQSIQRSETGQKMLGLKQLYDLQGSDVVMPTFDQVITILNKVLDFAGNLPVLSNRDLRLWKTRTQSLKDSSNLNLNWQKTIFQSVDQAGFLQSIFSKAAALLSSDTSALVASESQLQRLQGDFIDQYGQFVALIQELERSIIRQKQRIGELDAPPVYEAEPPSYKDDTPPYE